MKDFVAIGEKEMRAIKGGIPSFIIGYWIVCGGVGALKALTSWFF